MRFRGTRIILPLMLAWLVALPAARAAETKPTPAVDFATQVAPILEPNCLRCHNEQTRKGKLSLHSRDAMLAGGKSGAVVKPGSSDASTLVDMITSPFAEMPDKAEPLSDAQVEIIARWIDAGAPWPKGVTLRERVKRDLSWWSLQPLKRPVPPEVSDADAKWCRTPIDHFIIAKLREKGLSPSPEADRRTLIRRLHFDLIGLPPTPEEIDAFVNDRRDTAYERLVDRLLASPRYGERWARHWLDVVHYGDTHGYDKDKPRPNAWPYRDYVIRAFNDDKPYTRFVREQVAGDVLYPHTRDGIEATGFLAAGPWDLIGHAEVPESKIDGKVARLEDRDDMVRTVFKTFTSMTVGCARCHDHKFDPVSMEEYYGLHAVFAALDRADRAFDADPRVAKRRRELSERKVELEARSAALTKKIHELAGPELAKLEARIAALSEAAAQKKERPEFGYHSGIEKQNDVVKWVQVDLGESVDLDAIMLVGCHDDYNNIGAGFGFPVRFRVAISDDATFAEGVTVVADHSDADFANPGVTPQRFAAGGKAGRYVRVTATKLANRQADDHIFALAELKALTADGANVARGKTVTSLDSIEAPVRWRRSNLVDGYYYGVWNDKTPAADGELTKLREQRDALLARVITDEMKAERQRIDDKLAATDQAIESLPPQQHIYSGHVYHGSGNFRGRGGLGPREIHVLNRGQVTQPGEVAQPRTVDIILGVSPHFDLPADHTEGDRRVALAEWLTRKDHPLTWRSIVNRVWLYHFGRGIVDSPGDFGRMGQRPTHPELLDWLAVEFRDGGQSFKKLHRLIVTSAVYRQSSQRDDRSEAARIDAGNRYYWRQNRRRLEAEAIRDAVLQVAGKLDLKMGGPAFQDFVIDKPQHSPHYLYGKYDPNDPSTHRRSVYRFIVRSQPQPFMDSLDCADPSQLVQKRDETLTALQALTLMNNPFMLTMSEQFAARLGREHDDVESRIAAAFRLALGRAPSESEGQAVVAFAREHGLANACRVIFNMNEFLFVD